MFTLISFDIFEVWQNHFLLGCILRTIKERMTQALTAELPGKMFSPHCRSCQRDAGSLSLCSIMCAIQMLSSCFLSKRALTTAAEGTRLDRVGGESPVGNHLPAKKKKGTAGANTPARCCCAAAIQEVSLMGRQSGTETGETHSGQRTSQLKHWSCVFTGKVLVSLLSDRGKWKEWTGLVIQNGGRFP